MSSKSRLAGGVWHARSLGGRRAAGRLPDGLDELLASHAQFGAPPVGPGLTGSWSTPWAGLIYVGKTGALNETVADYFGNAIDLTASGTPMSLVQPVTERKFVLVTEPKGREVPSRPGKPSRPQH
ncbi:hypothetical protein ACM614_14740 [Streptomyces sp. 12297]